MHMAGQGEQQAQQVQQAQQAQQQQAEQGEQPEQQQQGQQQQAAPQKQQQQGQQQQAAPQKQQQPPQQQQSQPASANRKARSKAQMLHERQTQRAAAPPSPSRVPWQPAVGAAEQPAAAAAPQPLVTLELAAGSHISMQTVPPGTAVSLEASTRGTLLLQLSLPPGGKLSFGLGPDAAAPAAAASSSLFGAFPGGEAPVLSHTPVFDWQPAAASPAFVLRHKPVVLEGIPGEGQPPPPRLFGWRQHAADVPQPPVAEHSGGGSGASSPTPPPDSSPHSAAAAPAAPAAAQPSVGQVPGAAAEQAAGQVPAAEAGDGAGAAGQAVLSLALQDRHWDQPELPPDWHLAGGAPALLALVGAILLLPLCVL